MTCPVSVGAAQEVDDAGNRVRDHPHVVDRQVAVAADAERGTHVGGADAHGEDPLAVFDEQCADLRQFVVAGLAVHQCGRFEHRHRIQVLAEPLRCRGQFVEECTSRRTTELRNHESGQHLDAGGQQIGDPPKVLGRPHPDEQLHPRTTVDREPVERVDGVEQRRLHLVVGHRVLEVQDHRADTVTGPSKDGVREVGPRRRHVQRRAQRDGQHRTILVRPERLRSVQEQPAVRLGIEVVEVPNMLYRSRHHLFANAHRPPCHRCPVCPLIF